MFRAKGATMAFSAVQTPVVCGREVTEEEFEASLAGRLECATYQRALRVYRLYGQRSAEKVWRILLLATQHDCVEDVVWALDNVCRHRFSQLPYDSEEEKGARDLLAWRLIDELCAWLFFEVEFISLNDRG